MHQQKWVLGWDNVFEWMMCKRNLAEPVSMKAGNWLDCMQSTLLFSSGTTGVSQCDALKASALKQAVRCKLTWPCAPHNTQSYSPGVHSSAQYRPHVNVSHRCSCHSPPCNILRRPPPGSPQVLPTSKSVNASTDDLAKPPAFNQTRIATPFW